MRRCSHGRDEASGKLSHGDHLCLIYGTEDEHTSAIVPFIEAGLEKNEKVLYITDTRSAEEILGKLKSGNVSPEKFISKKQLVILSSSESCVERGKFDPDRMLRRELDSALGEGYSGLRVTGEMSWVPRNLPGSDRLIEYEAKLDKFFPGKKAIALCQYDRRKFPAEILLDILQTHPAAVAGRSVYENFYYMPPGDMLGASSAEREFDQRLVNLASRIHESEVITEIERLLKTLIANVPGVIYRRSWDKDWTMEYMSNEVENITGYPPGDFIRNSKRSYGSIIHPDDREAAEKAVSENVTIKKSFSVCYRILTSSGEVKWMEENGRGVFGGGGELICLDGIIIDITRLKNAEESLAERNSFINAVMDNLPLGIAVNTLGPSVKFSYMNEKFSKIYGVSRDELMKPGAFWDAVYRDPVFREKIKKRVEDDCASGDPARMNWENVPVVLENGETRWISASNIPVPAKDFMVSTVRDVTSQKRAEGALRKSEKRFRDIAEAAGEYIWELDSKNRYVFVSERIENVFKRPVKDIIGRTPFDFMPADEIRRVKKIVLGIIREEKPFKALECRLLMPDGQIKWESVSGVPVYDEAGRLSGYRGTALDITGRRKIEEENRLLLERLTFILKSTKTGVNIIDTDYNMVYIDPGWKEAYGPFDGRKCFEYFMGRSSVCDGCMVEEALESGETRVSERTFPKEKNRCVQTNIFPFSDEKGNMLVAQVNTDITELKRSERRIGYLNTHDALTGLFNRKSAEEALKKMDKRESMPISIMMLDVNGLKLVNDSYGRGMGDALLLEASKIIKKFSGRKGVAARWGADEFVIIKPRTSCTVAGRMAEGIKEAAGSVTVGQVPLSISAGYAVKSRVGEKISNVLRDAENLLDKNKLQEASSMRSSLINTLLNTLDVVSNETNEHTKRLKEIALALGKSIGLPQPELDRLSLLVTLHDIGKIAVPEAILDKPGKLNRNEWEIIKKHSEAGYRIALSTKEFAHVAEEILKYHEKWDGSGYPTGAEGEDIPVLARIGAIVDAYDAMTNERPYRQAMAAEEAMDELKKCAGSQFDPRLVDMFLQLKNT